MFGGFGVTELLLVLAITMVLVGTGKLRTIGTDVGLVIKGFRQAVKADRPGHEKVTSDQDESLIK